MSSAATAPTGAKPAVRHEWYQTPEAVTFTLFVKNAPKDATVEIQHKSFSISYALPTGSEFAFAIENLAGEIDPAKSKYMILGTKIELKLHKLVAGKWAALESSDAEIVAGAVPPAYPTSSKKGAKNWDSVAKELATGAEEEEGDAAMHFFKKLYEDADDDTRRAMLKSYTESNGTNLSTNWDSVAKEAVKTEAPNGMEPKKW